MIKTFNASVAGPAVLAVLLNLKLTQRAKREVELLGMGSHRRRIIIPEDEEGKGQERPRLHGGVLMIQKQVLPPDASPEDFAFHSPESPGKKLSQREEAEF